MALRRHAAKSVAIFDFSLRLFVAASRSNLQRLHLPRPGYNHTHTRNGAQRLSKIENLTPSNLNLSTFGYTYDIAGQIKTWSRQNDAASVLTSSFNYDPLGQLLAASVPNAAGVLKNYTYGYDLAGNRKQEQIDSGVTTSVHNNLNQLTGQSPGGAMEFAGSLNEPATVTLAGKPATVDGSNNWIGKASVTTGANAIPLVATDASGNSTTKTINLVVSGGAARTLAFDLAGNETDNGVGQVYTYDALNRLKTITQGGNVTEFVYNGVGQRVQEKLNGTLIKQWVWDGGAQPAEERDAAGNVTKRFFGDAGEQIGGTNYYYTRDHLGSVREMTDSTGAIRARYEYDPYGRQTKVSGDLESDFGFTGFYRHQASGLNLTKFRAYDADLGRWINRDPIAEMGGLNLYAYVGNNPINMIDPLGLSWWSATTSFAGGLVSSAVFGYAVGFLTVAAASAAIAPALAIAAGVTAVIAAGYGGFELGKGLYTWATGQEYSFDGNGRILSEDEYIDHGAGFLGSLLGGSLIGKGYLSGWENDLRIAPFGNRTGNPCGELPHYHRRVPHPNPRRAGKGESAPNQGKGNHRPWEGGW